MKHQGREKKINFVVFSFSLISYFSNLVFVVVTDLIVHWAFGAEYWFMLYSRSCLSQKPNAFIVPSNYMLFYLLIASNLILLILVIRKYCKGILIRKLLLVIVAGIFLQFGIYSIVEILNTFWENDVIVMYSTGHTLQNISLAVTGTFFIIPMIIGLIGFVILKTKFGSIERVLILLGLSLSFVSGLIIYRLIVS